MKPLLYHGSPAVIDRFIPREGKDASRNDYFGTMATASKEMAMLYALKLKEGYDPASGQGALGGVKDQQGNDPKDFMLANNDFNGTFVALFRDRARYLEALERSGGGHIYTVPNDTFNALPKPERTPTVEWVSQAPDITPQASERVTLEKAMQSGAQILFLKDGVDVGKLVSDHPGQWDEGEKQLALYKELIQQGVLINENAARGIPNPLDLPAGPERSVMAPLLDYVQGSGKFTGNPRNAPNTANGPYTANVRNAQGRVSDRVHD